MDVFTPLAPECEKTRRKVVWHAARILAACELGPLGLLFLGHRGLTSKMEFQMTLRRVTTLLALSMAFVVAGCATKPATQWWRVGNCLVLYEQNSREKQLVAVGQGCDIKRDTVTAAGEVN